MKFLFWLLLLFAAAVVLGTAAQNSAYVQLVYPPYRVELSFTLFVVLCLLAFASGYALLRTTLNAVGLPSYVAKYRRERRATKSRKALDDALYAYFEGRYAEAERVSAKAIVSGIGSPLHTIIAARSAHELREYEKRDAYLANAEGKTVGENTLRLMAKTQFLLDQKQPQSALSSIRELSESGIRKHVGVLNLELKAQQQAHNWDAVLDVVAQLEKRKAIDKVILDQLRQQAWLEKLRGHKQDIFALRALWKSVPEQFKHRSKIVAAAARAFIRLEDCASAQRLIADILNAQWDSELVALYGECQSGNVVEQIEQAENWLNVHRQDAGLLLSLGKLCMHQELWGKAQNYLDASISLEPSHAAYTALGQLAEKMGKHELALAHFQKAAQFG